jgi:tetratricopeptide (TPR) repeat protein
LVVWILLRPWLDGVTYPTDNLYFTWGVLLLFALWAARVMLRGESVCFGVPILLLLGFWVVAAVTAAATVQYETTYRSLILWAGHLALFIVVVNGLRSSTATGIALTAFVVCLLAETVWSLIHFKYVLPYVREAVNNNPVLLKTYFLTTSLNPELRHRLEVNRAFGSLLFPNALAALLLLGIPYALAGTLHSARLLRRENRKQQETGKGPVVQAATPLATLAVGISTWLVTVCLSYFLFSFVASFEFPLGNGLQRVAYLPLIYGAGGGYQLDGVAFSLLWILFVVLVPMAAGIAGVRTTQRNGVAAFGHLLRTIGFPMLFVLQSLALWWTYSRGALLALFLATAFTLAVLAVQRVRARGTGPLIGAGTAAALSILFLALSVGGGAFSGSDNPPRETLQQEIPAPAPAAPVQGPAGELPFQAVPEFLPIRVEGVDLTFQDLVNPASFYLRLSYWRSGLDMALDNLWTGVGLGNFGTVYPKYQRPGAGDVKAAHNDYLQALCETGIFGFLLFCGFWAYFIFWGARRLLQETDPRERWILAGLYAGVLAFLIHSLVDFNFFNPALAFFAFLLTGAFYARGSVRGASPARVCTPGTGSWASAQPAPANRGPESSGTERALRFQLLGIPMLVGAAVIAGMAAQVYLCDFIIGGHNLLNVGNMRKLNQVYDAGEFFIKGVAADQEPGKYPAKDVVTVGRLIPDREAVERFGVIYVTAPDSPTKHRRLRRDEPVPQNAFVAIAKPELAQKTALEHIDVFLANLVVADRIFPHGTELAGYFCRWYLILAKYVKDPALKQRYSLDFLNWARTAVERSPEHAPFHEFYGKACFVRGKIEPGPERKEYYDQSIAEFKHAAELYPSAPYFWRQYAESLRYYAKLVREELGEQALADARLAEAVEIDRHAAALEQQRGS